MCIPVAIKHIRLYFVSSFYFDVQEERPFTCHCSLLMPRLMSTLAYKDQSTYFTGNETNTLQSTPVLFFFFLPLFSSSCRSPRAFSLPILPSPPLGSLYKGERSLQSFAQLVPVAPVTARPRPRKRRLHLVLNYGLQ